MTTKIINSLAGLPAEVTVKKLAHRSNYEELWISFPESERVCPHCGSHDCTIKNSSRDYTVYHSAVHHRSTHLHMQRKRYYCKSCRRTFMQHPEWLHPTLHITQLLYIDICLSLTKMQSLRAVAEENGVSESIVYSILDLISFDTVSNLPETIAIDEFKGDSDIWDSDRHRWLKGKYHTNIVDGDDRSVIDVLPVIRVADLKKYFRQFPKSERDKVRFYCCDMHNGFVSVAKEMFPRAMICIDMFHVIKHLNECVSSIRVQLQRDLDPSAPNYRLLKGSMRMLVAKESGIDSKYDRKALVVKKRIDKLLKSYPYLNEAYQALQCFHYINDMTIPALQRAQLTEWLEVYCSSDVPEIRHVANMVRHWRGYIQNTWKYNKSNGVCEGYNNRIKVLKRICYGLHNFESFRKRILLTCSSTQFVTSPATLFQRNRTQKGGSQL